MLTSLSNYCTSVRLAAVDLAVVKAGTERRGPSRVALVVLAAFAAIIIGGLVALGGGPRDLRHWPAGLVQLHVAAGIALGAALLVLPPLVAALMRRAGRAIDWRFIVFAACLAVLGLTQFAHLATFWLPMFWLEAALKLVGAGLALAVLAVVTSMLPALLARPSQKQWRETTELLRAEIDTHRAAEVRAREAREFLEARFSERTVELATVNDMLSRQGEWLRVILSTIADGVIATDPQGRVVFMNPVAERLTRWREADAQGQPIDRLWRLQDAGNGEVRESLVERVIASGAVEHADAARVRLGLDAAPSLIEQTGVPLRAGDGALRGVVLFVRDLTDVEDSTALRRQLMEGHAAPGALLDALFEAAPVGLGYWDRELRCVRVNRTLARINGLPVEAHIGRPVDELLPALAPQLAQHFRRVLDEGRALRDLEIVGETADLPGRVRWWRVSYFPVHDGEARIGVGVIIDEITQAKQAERERSQLLDSERAAREAAERANTLKDEFLATVSHELRNPLNSIVGWTHMLESGKLSAADQSKAVAVIARNARTQVRLVEDLLDFSRLGSGRLRLEVRQIDPGSVVAAACESFRAAAEARHIALVCDQQAEGVLVAADADRLQQIVTNLVSNALKFTESGGSVRVSTARADSQLEIAVEDDGAGVDEQFLPYMFEPFSQAEGAGARHQAGLGLGLAIVKSLVSLHGGTIAVTSAGRGKGTRVTVRLPIVAIVEGGSAELRAAEERQALRGIAVLVVDDAADARNAVQEALREFGAEVVLADSTAAALTALESGHIDVLVADIGMPYEDGYALIHQVRAHPRHRTLPAIALTAHGSDADRARMREAGFHACQVKPAPVPALVREIADLARQQ